MTNSVLPHRQQPTRLTRPWDSPGKNTGVGCHFLLQRIKVKSESEVAQSCPTLSDPMESATKARPLSDPILVGNPNLGTISLSRHWATSDALSVQVGKSSIQPENVYTMTSKQVTVVLMTFHFSEVHSQVFKGQRAFQLNSWRFLSVPRGSINLWAGSMA